MNNNNNSVAPVLIKNSFTLPNQHLQGVEFCLMEDLHGKQNVGVTSNHNINVEFNAATRDIIVNGQIAGSLNNVIVNPNFNMYVIDLITGQPIQDQWGLINNAINKQNNQQQQQHPQQQYNVNNTTNHNDDIYGNGGAGNQSLDLSSSTGDIYGGSTQTPETVKEEPIVYVKQETVPQSSVITIDKKPFLPTDLKAVITNKGEYAVMRKEDYLKVFDETSNNSGVNALTKVIDKQYITDLIGGENQTIVECLSLNDLITRASRVILNKSSTTQFGFVDAKIYSSKIIETLRPVEGVEELNLDSSLYDFIEVDFISTCNKLKQSIEFAISNKKNFAIGALTKEDEKLTARFNAMLKHIKDDLKIDSLAKTGAELADKLDKLTDALLANSIKSAMNEFNAILKLNRQELENTISDYRKANKEEKEASILSLFELDKESGYKEAVVQDSYKVAVITNSIVNNQLSYADNKTGQSLKVTEANTPELYALCKYVNKEHDFVGEWLFINGFSDEVYQVKRGADEKFSIRYKNINEDAYLNNGNNINVTGLNADERKALNDAINALGLKNKIF